MDRPNLLPESANGAVKLAEVTAFGHVMEHQQHSSSTTVESIHEGKAKVARNAFVATTRPLLRELARALREQRHSL